MSPTFVYVACAADGTADVFTFDAGQGSLALLARTPKFDGVRTLAINPGHGLLYAGLNGETPLVRTFTINGDSGTLTAGPDVELPATNTYVSLSNDGSRLFSASYLDGAVSSVSVHANGGLAQDARIAATPGPQAHSVIPGPGGAHVYAASTGADRLAWYTPANDGTLVEAGAVTSPEGSGPRHFRFSPDGTKLYLLHEMTGMVRVFDRDLGTGALTEIQSLQSVPDVLGLSRGTLHTPTSPPVDPHRSPIWCADVQLAGHFLFTTERTSSTISTFAVDPDSGLLTHLRTTPTETQPRGAAVTPDHDFLLVCGELSHAMSVYRIDPRTGDLERTDRVETARGPMWIECHVRD